VTYRVFRTSLHIQHDWRFDSFTTRVDGGELAIDALERMVMRLAWGIVAVLMIPWLLGIDHHAPRSLIPLLLVVAIISFAG
jgi:hypothetical protein